MRKLALNYEDFIKIGFSYPTKVGVKRLRIEVMSRGMCSVSRYNVTSGTRIFGA